ncbi:MAG: hypothetical protein FWG55_00320 [Candidatus Bathyarchaeota archaeon]|nr:hypothetical protein [Candidatus Termiticorpusculum sp.]
MGIKTISIFELRSALDLVWEVFNEFEALIIGKKVLTSLSGLLIIVRKKARLKAVSFIF